MGVSHTLLLETPTGAEQSAPVCLLWGPTTNTVSLAASRSILRGFNMDFETETDTCDSCGNHAVVVRAIEGDAIRECEVCGNLEGPADLIELLELQREADGLGVSIDSFPLAQFIEGLPGVRIIGDSGGDKRQGTMPFVAFELADHRTWQLENLGQALRLMRAELECEWSLEFTYDFQMAFELHPRHDGKAKHSTEQVLAARRDLTKIWRRLNTYRGLSWWKQE